MRNGLAVDFPPMQSVADKLIHFIDGDAHPESAIGHKRGQKVHFVSQSIAKFPNQQGGHPFGGKTGEGNTIFRADAGMNTHDHIHVG